jgi:mutator protein MutT
MDFLYQIRVTGILIENENILIVKQRVSSNRNWSLPGGRLEHGETIQEGIIRELKEETGLNVKIIKLLYICEKNDVNPPLIHITFLLKKISGHIRLPSNEFDKNPIHDVKMVEIKKLKNYGFTEKFVSVITNGFKDSGTYKGNKSSIGL